MVESYRVIIYHYLSSFIEIMVTIYTFLEGVFNVLARNFGIFIEIR